MTLLCKQKFGFFLYVVCSKLLPSCPNLCNPMDYSLPAPLSVGFSRQEYWSGLPCASPGDLPHPGTEPQSPRRLHWQAGSLPLLSPYMWYMWINLLQTNYVTEGFIDK